MDGRNSREEQKQVARGVVREFLPEEGWGVVDANEVPGGCWVHFSMIHMQGYAQLIPGQVVEFTFEPADQDGYTFRAVDVWVK